MCNHDWVIDNEYVRLKNGMAITNHSCRKCDLSLGVPDIEVMIETQQGYDLLNDMLRDYVQKITIIN